MNREMRYDVAIAVAVMFTLAMVVVEVAQERPERETRTWQALTLPEANYHADARVDVIDTQGVCLYVVRTATWGSSSVPAAMFAAVPKTQLPAGAGCQ